MSSGRKALSAEYSLTMSDRPRILVTGASGVIGWNLCRDLSGCGLEVAGTYRSNPPELPGVSVRRLELDRPASIANQLLDLGVSLVVHCAAMTQPDLCELDPASTRRVNVDSVAALLEWRPDGVPLVYLSTDLVFDGNRGLYREDDRPRPVNLYGESKLHAEALVRSHPDTLVFRIAKIYSAGSPFHPCFTDWMRTRFEGGEPVPLFIDQYRSPLWVGDVTRAVIAVLEQGVRSPLYHLGGPERLSRLDFGLAYARAMGYDQGLIRPFRIAESGMVVRGADCSLNSDRFWRDYGLRPTSSSDGLAQLRAEKSRKQAGSFGG